MDSVFKMILKISFEVDQSGYSFLNKIKTTKVGAQAQTFVMIV